MGRTKSQRMPDPLWISEPLSALIAPTTVDTFFTEYYEQQALHVKRDEPDRYADLLSVDRIDDILASVDLSADSLEMARAEPRVGVSDFTFTDGVVDRGAVTCIATDARRTRATSRAVPRGRTGFIPVDNGNTSFIAVFTY